MDQLTYPADKVQALTMEINRWNMWCQEADAVFSVKITSNLEGG